MIEDTVMKIEFNVINDDNGNAKITDSYGDTMEFWIKVENKIITAASFAVDGCEHAVTCGNALVSLIKGKMPCSVHSITKEQILQEAGVSDTFAHCALLTMRTVVKAIDNYKSKHKITCTKNDNCGDSHNDIAISECDNSSRCDVGCSATEADCSLSCNSVDQCNKSDENKNKLQNIKHKIAVLSGKGGVGKSTISINLAFMLAASGYKVGLLDADIHGPSIPTMLNLTEAVVGVDDEGITPVTIGSLKVISVGFFLKNNSEALIWRGPVKIGILNQFLHDVKWGDLDFLIIDLPPGTGDEPISIGQTFTSGDGAVIVTTPQEVASSDVRKSITFCKTMKMPILGIVENMSGFICPHCEIVTNIFGSQGGQNLAKTFGINLLGEIPIDPNIVIAGDAGKPYMETYINSSKSSIIFKQVVSSILKALASN